MFEYSNLSYLTFVNVLLLLAYLSSGLDYKTSSLSNLISLAIFELQHLAIVIKNISKHREDPNFVLLLRSLSVVPCQRLNW